MPRAGVLTLFVALVLSVAGCSAGNVAEGSAARADRPTAPAEMRLLGAHGVVIAVPESWAQTGDDPCRFGVPDRSYVLIESPASPATLMAQAEKCVGSGALDETASSSRADESLAVEVGPLYSTVVKVGDDPDPTPTPLVRDDLEIDAWVDCDDLGEPFGVLDCAATWQLPDQHLSFSVRVPGAGGPELIEQMADSIRRLPAGWTTSQTDGTVVRDED